MLRKLSLVFVATAMVSAGAFAQVSSPFPASPNEIGPHQADAYVPPVATPVSATTFAADMGPFPSSVSENGPNYPESPAVYARTPGEPSRAAMQAQSERGSPAEAAATTLRVGPSVRHVNVRHFERVRLIDEQGRSFVWKFDTLTETRFPLSAIAPAEFEAAQTVVYVTHPYSHLHTD